MEKQFVTYEIALKLKELGFNELCLGWWCWINGNKGHFYDYKISNTQLAELNNHKNNCSAPLWQQIIEWFNDKYGIFITLALVANGYGFYIHKDYNTTNKGENYGLYPTLYKAREQAILKAIELC